MPSPDYQKVDMIYRKTHYTRQRCILAICVLAIIACPLYAQQSATVDIARNSVEHLSGNLTSRNLSIYGVTLGKPWSEARTVLDRANIPYIFEKGSSPAVYIPPQNSTYYFILNPSSYEVIEMGILGISDLPLDNQFLFDGQRWRLTTARMQFFGTEGEFIVNEEGEAFNFPYKGIVLKYLNPTGFRFILVDPTDKPLTSMGHLMKPGGKPTPTTQPSADAGVWVERFKLARDQFEAKRYKSALDAFKKIVDETDDQLMKVRSSYWMGECYYGLKQYANAKAQFNNVLAQTDIESLRTPASKMIARCNKRLGKK